MHRFIAIAALACATAGSSRGEDASMARYNVVAIKPATTSIYIATVTMTMQPFVRKNIVYSSTYSARVFPYFFYNEKGRIWIVVPEDLLRRADRGESVDFTGRAISESGGDRRVEGHATPTGAARGNIRVKVFVTRRIVLTYDTTYELVGVAAPKQAVTAK